MPNKSRFAVTIGTGLLATLAGMFPAVAMRLLGFVALYGLVLMPMGAVIFADFWLLPKLGLKQYYAEHRSLKINWAAGIAWIFTLIICVALVKSGKPQFQIFFVSLPGWFIACGLYVGLSKLQQMKESV